MAKSSARSIESKIKPLGIVHLHGQGVLTIETVTLGGYTRAYLGEKGRRIVRGMIRSREWQLDRGEKSARFAAITENGSREVLALFAEYGDGTCAMLADLSDPTPSADARTLSARIEQYLELEARAPFVKKLGGWEDVTPGAVIRETFTSRDTFTGAWAKTVAVIDPDRCNACQQCGIWCPEDVIVMDPVTGKLSIVDYDYCKGCALCHHVCPPEAAAIEMVDEKRVKAAQPKVFDGVYGKRIEVQGDLVKRGFERITSRADEAEYEVIYRETTGKKSISGMRILQVLHRTTDTDVARRPLLYTFFSKKGKQWTQVVRPFATILVYGTSDEDKMLAARLQLDGFRVVAAAPGRATPSTGNRGDFEKASVFSCSTLESIVGRNDSPIDAVVTAHYGTITPAQDKLIMERVGVLRAPFMPTRTRDTHLEAIITDIQAAMPDPETTKDDRPLARMQTAEGDIAAGHRLCAGCPVAVAFNLAVEAVRDIDPEIAVIHSGATGCAEVATTIYPDTAWPNYLHTTFGALGANLEGINAAARYLSRRGTLKKKVKIFGWGGDGGTYDIGLQALSGFLERGLAKDSVYFCYDNGAYMNTGIQRSSATPMGAATSTSPIGEVIPGKPQFRKDLEHIAGAHNSVYVARVSPAYQIDFINKIKRAVEHDGPALIVSYSNCTVGHRTGTDFAEEQSRLAVECGFWPLFEIENGETRLNQPPPSAFNPRVRPEHKVTLLQWMQSEGRFAQHFDKHGSFVSREHQMLYRELERQLLMNWRKLQSEDKLTRKRDKLMEELTACLRENDAKRLKDLTAKPHMFGLGGYTQVYMDELSWIGEGGKPRPLLKRVLASVRRCLDLDEYKLKDRDLREKLYDVFVNEYRILIEDQQALDNAKAMKAAMGRDAVNVLQSAAGPTMDDTEKQENRAVIGPRPLAGRIFARAGDGGVTAAKLFVSLLKDTGLFGKAAPDYGPERRGAPVGTNFTIGGRELRTQAGFEDLVFSVVVNPDDPGWPIRQWRDAVVEGGAVVINTPLRADAARQRYRIPDTHVVVTADASAVKASHRVPETVTLLAGLMKALVQRGVVFPEDYLTGQWKKLLAKEFADKARPEKIVRSNTEAFWNTFHDADLSEATGAGAPRRGDAPSDAFKDSPPAQLMTGSEAIAEAWRQINPGVFAMFPITPSTEVGQVFSQFWADGKVDTEFIHTESEHSSFITIIAAAAAGVRAVTSTASQGMLLGKEGGLLAASLRLPVVVNVGARETNAPLSIHAGHTDFYQFRDDGWIHFVARNAQEAYDFALIAQRAAEKAGLPAFINQDGFIVTHTKDMLDILSDDAVQAFVGEYDPEHSLLKTGGTYNPVALQDYYSEHVRTLSEAQKAVPGIIDDVFDAFARMTGRRYTRLHDYRTEGAAVVVVAMGSTEGTTMDAVDELRDEGLNVGLVALKTFRPFPADEIRRTLGKARTVIVMDRANAHGAELTPLGLEIQAAIRKPVLNLEYGRGGRNTPPSLVKDIYRLGLMLDERVDRQDVEALFSAPDPYIQALLRDLELLEGEQFAQRFVEHLAAGRLIEALGPREHIDVRETTKRREIKLQIIRQVVASRSPVAEMIV